MEHLWRTLIHASSSFDRNVWLKFSVFLTGLSCRSKVTSQTLQFLGKIQVYDRLTSALSSDGSWLATVCQLFLLCCMHDTKNQKNHFEQVQNNTWHQRLAWQKSSTNTEQVPCLVHMNVIVNTLYSHIYKITGVIDCSVDDCSFKVLLRQSQGYDACKKKKGLCYITEEEATQTRLRCTVTCNHDNSKG